MRAANTGQTFRETAQENSKCCNWYCSEVGVQSADWHAADWHRRQTGTRQTGTVGRLARGKVARGRLARGKLGVGKVDHLHIALSPKQRNGMQNCVLHCLCTPTPKTGNLTKFSAVLKHAEKAINCKTDKIRDTWRQTSI